MSKIGSWSTSAGSNTATPPDGFPEGMAPSGVNDAAREVMAQIKTFCNDAEWFDRDWTPTYVNANSFTVTGDRTGTLVAGRALKLYDASTITRFVQSASFTAVTTVALESGTAITSSLSSFATAILNPAAPSKPQTPIVSIKIGVPQSLSVTATGHVVIFQGTGAGAVVSNTFSWYSQTTGRFQPQWPGWYDVKANIDLAGAPSAIDYARCEILKNGATAGGVYGPLVVFGNGTNPLVGAPVAGIVQMNGSSDYLDCRFFCNVSTQVASSQSWFQAYYIGK